MDRLISQAEAIEWLRKAIEHEGQLKAFAAKVGVAPPVISRMLNGHRFIHGKVAQYLGLKRIDYYELTLVVPSTLQEQYAKQREHWAEQNGRPLPKHEAPVYGMRHRRDQE